MHWSEPYVGLPWAEKGDTHAGCSCWGLCCLAYRERFAIDLPSYAERFASHAELAQIDAVIADAAHQAPWLPVKIEDARAMDVVIYKRMGVESHVGLIVVPGRMLHIENGLDSAIVDIRHGKWAPRLAGVYRHEALA